MRIPAVEVAGLDVVGEAGDDCSGAVLACAAAGVAEDAVFDALEVGDG